MTDRDIDLIRAAGKAAGLTLQLALGFTEGDRGLHTADGKEWNPLTDDGDAFRLAVALRIDIPWQPIPPDTSEDDERALIRRAIVRAAAAIGAKWE